MFRACGFLLACLGMACLAMSWAVATEPGRPADLIAAHIRLQGYRCDKPQGARREATVSEDDAASWVVNCGNGTYRLRLIPGQSVDVQPLD
jgi:hypothetical protein